MFLFSRVVTLKGGPRKIGPMATTITNYINANSAIGSSCWAATFGYPLGTLIWSNRVESQASFASATAGLLADPGYLDLAEQAEAMSAGPAQDRLVEIVHGSPSAPPALGSVVLQTTAAAVIDRMADAVAWSVEIAHHVEGVTGSPVFVTIDVFGQMGTIGWLGITPDLAASDTARAKVGADPGYLERLGASKGLFISGSGHVAQGVRIA
jgi:hypothetical protein